MGSDGAVVARSAQASGASVEGPSAGGQRGVVADPDGVAVAASASLLRVLEDRLQPAPTLVRGWHVGGVLAELQRGCDLAVDRWVVAVDSTVVRAHHHAAGARLEPPVDVPRAVLASALAEDLTEAVAADTGAVAASNGPTGGWIESHESAA